MKLNSLLVIIFLGASQASSQKNDFNWMFGYGGLRGDDRFGLSLVDFNYGNPLSTKGPPSKMYIHEANSTISDINGRLLYFTNGYDVVDYKLKKVSGATDLGKRYWEALIANQGALFLNNPDNNYSFYLVYINLELDTIERFRVNKLRYILIDTISMSAIQKGDIIIDTLNDGFLSACKHANGRDWWIVSNQRNTNIFYKTLISDKEVTLFDSDTLGPSIIDGLGQAVFSPNGEYFITYESISDREGAYIYIYKFNRCTGAIQFLDSTHINKKGVGGISFSNNSKYIYHSSGLILRQTETLDPNRFKNFIQIDSITDQAGWGSQYYTHQSAPDGRIYIANSFANPLIHVIHKPDEKGKAVRSQHNGFLLKTLDGFSIPNLPNFRLGPIDGSSCDTLGINNVPWAWWRYDQDTANHLCFEFIDLSAYEITDRTWTFGDGAQSKEKSPIHCFSRNGTYEVCLIVSNKNGVDTLCRILNIGPSSIDDTNNNYDIELHPNPCNEFFIINVLQYIPQRMILKLYDLDGKEVLTQRLYEGSNGIDVHKISPGIYNVIIQENDVVVHNERVVVVHD